MPASFPRGADALVAYKPVIGSPSPRANACLKVKRREVMADGSTFGHKAHPYCDTFSLAWTKRCQFVYAKAERRDT